MEDKWNKERNVEDYSPWRINDLLDDTRCQEFDFYFSLSGWDKFNHIDRPGLVDEKANSTPR